MKKLQPEIRTENFCVGKFHSEWYQRGFTEWGTRQPLPDSRSTESLSIPFCTQEDFDPPNHIGNLTLFKEAIKPSSRGSTVDQCIRFFIYFPLNYASKTSICFLLDHILRGVLWFTEFFISEFFNFIHIEIYECKSSTEKYL